VSRYQNGKTNLDFTEARDSEWQWHQVCTWLQTDNHASTPPKMTKNRSAVGRVAQTFWDYNGIIYKVNTFKKVCFSSTGIGNQRE